MKPVWATAALAVLAILILAAPQETLADSGCDYCSGIPCVIETVESFDCTVGPDGSLECGWVVEEYEDCSEQNQCYADCEGWIICDRDEDY